MDGTAVLLPLKPPHYEPRVLVAGGASHGTNWSSSEGRRDQDRRVDRPRRRS
jgi:hypothetical protein